MKIFFYHFSFLNMGNIYFIKIKIYKHQILRNHYTNISQIVPKSENVLVTPVNQDHKAPPPRTLAILFTKLIQCDFLCGKCLLF